MSQSDPTPSAAATLDRRLLLGLGLLLAVNSVLGPLVLEVIEYRFPATLVYQGMGLDFVSLVLVAPLCLFAAFLARRRRRISAALALPLGSYAAYMAVQYAIGPEYLVLPGNNERFFLLHLALFVAGGAVAIRGWSGMDAATLSSPSLAGRRTLGSLLLALGILLVLRYVPPLVELVSGDPTFAEYLASPTSFLLIAWMDLGVFAAAALVGSVALLRARPWAGKVLLGIVGWLALVGIAVAAMSVTMTIHGDPAASPGQTAGFVVAAMLLASLAAWLYARPGLGSPAGPAGAGTDRDRKAAS